MAKNITLMGASYSNVPAVQLPQTGGGTATFTDVTDTTATASDVAQGKYFYNANGVRTAGTGSGGGGGGINNGSDVFFIDYDGSVVASYSKSNLEMPSNPSHTGLTSQGWNWTQQQIINQLNAYPNQPVYVGQMYITDDGKTRIYVHFEEGRTSPYLGLGVNGTVTIDWGDNTTSTLTGTSLTTAQNVQHLYQTGGDYVIKFTPTSGSFSIFGVGNGTHLLKKETSISTYTSRVYANAVQKVELGSNVSIGSYAFRECSSLVSITIPSNATTIGANAFYNCYSLMSITVPSGVATIGTNMFYNCSSLASIAIPSSVTSISSYAFRSCFSLMSITIPIGVRSMNNYAFYNCYSLASITIPSGVTSTYASMFYTCYSLASITIPSGVTSIASQTFNGCYGMAEYHFLRTTPPSLANTNAFTGIPSDCVIYVPYSEDHSILEAYQTATNWSTYASKMQEEPQ